MISNIKFKISFKFSEIFKFFGISKSPFKIFYYNTSKDEALKGIFPVTNENNNTPKLHISAEKFLYPISYMISGAKYAGVPHYSLMYSSFGIILLTPKSQILHLKLLSNKILSNFISL